MATLVRWEPIRELATLQTEMSRLMNGLFEGNGRTTQSWVPAVDVWETEGELVYAFDLPGVTLSSVYETDTLKVADLPEFDQEQVRGGIVADDYSDAKRIVGNLQEQVPDCPSDSGSGTGSSTGSRRSKPPTCTCTLNTSMPTSSRCATYSSTPGSGKKVADRRHSGTRSANSAAQSLSDSAIPGTWA